MGTEVTRAQARDYYEDFSLAVGLRDWLRPNARHEALKLRIDRLLGGRRGLRLLDVGCGAGVLTYHLRRFGDVVGIDFSAAAIAAARRLAPGIDFRVGSLDDLPPDARFDVITLFDALEHIPAAERPQLLLGVAGRLADGGLLFASTPFPAYTRHLREHHEAALQIIDEEVELPAVAAEAEVAGLRLIAFEAFDVWSGSPEYQAMVFTTRRAAGGPAALVPDGLERRLRLVASQPGQRAHRLLHAALLLARGRPRTAVWFLRADAPDAEA